MENPTIEALRPDYSEAPEWNPRNPDSPVYDPDIDGIGDSIEVPLLRFPIFPIGS